MAPATIASASAKRASAPTNFAGLLASMHDGNWNNDGLADDVATISYEHALRKQARSRMVTGKATPVPRQRVSPGTDATVADTCRPAVHPGQVKSASITIRLSEPECAQLRQRAVEAGLSMSAYLRSCTLEAESLRAQVKETLAQLRSSTSRPDLVVERHHRVRSLFVRVWCWLRLCGFWRRGMDVNPVNPFAPVRY